MVSNPLKQQTGVGGIRGAILWERNNDGPVDYVAANHHTLSVYLGGGVGTYSCERRLWGFSGAICLLPEGFDTKWQHNGFVKNLHFYFTPEDIENMNWASSDSVAPLIYTRNPTLNTLSAALVNDLDWEDPADRLAVDHVTLAIMSQISRSETSRAGVLAPSALRKIETRMRALEDGPPSLAALAADLNMSPRHLTRLFKATTHLTLAQRQRQIQIEEAQHMLSGPLPIAQIALACGFGSQSHFTRVFRAETGLTPAQWRRAF